MPKHNEHTCLPPPPTDPSTQQVASPQMSHNHADVMEVKWPSESELETVSALIQLSEFPLFFSNPVPQEEGHAQVLSAETKQQRVIDAPEKYRGSADDDVDDGSSFGSLRDPEFSTKKVVSNRKGKRNAITYGLHMSRLNSLVIGLTGPNNTSSVDASKQKAVAPCIKSEGFDKQARSSAATVDIKFTYVKSFGDTASRPHTGKQPSQPPRAMEDGRDAHQNLNKLRAENAKRASLEVGEPSSAAVLGATATRSALVLTHPPTRANRSRLAPDAADPSYEPALSKQARLELLAPKLQRRARRARAEVEEANPPFFFVANARVLKDAGNTQMSCRPFLEGELLYNENREFVKAKSITSLLKNGDDQEEE